MPEPKRQRNFRIEDSIWQAARDTAELRNERISEIIRQAVIAYIEQHKETNQ